MNRTFWKKVFQLVAVSIILIYGFFAVIDRSHDKNLALWKGLTGMGLIAIAWLLPYAPKNWLKERPHIILIQAYFVIRLVVLFISIYLLFGNGFLNLFEVLLGYFLLLLISLFSIKNE